MTDSSSAGPRERLLEAAEQLIYAGSIHGTGVDAIVRQSGTARKSFYSYFPSKEALVAAALQQRDVRWMNWFEQGTLARAQQPAQQLLAMFDVLHEWFSGGHYHGCAFLNAAGEIKHPQHDIFQVSRLHKARLLAFIEQRCVAGGYAQPAALARQWLVLVDGAIAVALVSGEAGAAFDAQQAAAAVLAACALA